MRKRKSKKTQEVEMAKRKIRLREKDNTDIGSPGGKIWISCARKEKEPVCFMK
jgi:hypothetical protein